MRYDGVDFRTCLQFGTHEMLVETINVQGSQGEIP